MDISGNISNDDVLIGVVSPGSIDMNYDKLKNKPSINGVELVGNKTSEDLGLGSTFSGSYNDLTDKPSIPTKTSELVNDTSFATETYVTNEIDLVLGNISTILSTLTTVNGG